MTAGYYTSGNTLDRHISPPAAQAQHQAQGPYTQNTMAQQAPNPTPKTVSFELLLPNTTQYRARLPMRVGIYPHDTTESIVTTVKNFYGIYGGPGGARGVSFEDSDGNTLIARYENFTDKMNVIVRVIMDEDHPSGAYGAVSPPLSGQHGYWKPEMNDNKMLPPPAHHSPLGSRPHSPTRETSPGHDRRSGSANGSSKIKRERGGNKSRGSSVHGSFNEIYSDNVGYSSGDGAPGSVSSRSKADLGNTEISLDNIVEGGRRKRAKFESSELPLFAPPQMPAATSNSSVSPARRMESQRQQMPFSHSGQHPFAAPQQMLYSPQSYSSGFAGQFATPNSDMRRSRGGPQYSSHRNSISITPNSNLLPTPDPTIGSCMSEEDKDVALQLMRLGDMSNNSAARTSTSTLDDTFSGRADVASSTGATSDEESASEDELPPARRQKLDYSPILPPKAFGRFSKQLDDNLPSESTEMSAEEYEDGRDGTFKPDTYGAERNIPDATGNKARSALPSAKPRAKSTKPTKTTKAPRSNNGAKPKAKLGSISNASKQPMSPASMSTHSRKTSAASAVQFQHQLGEDEEDLSSKPRCQRCRKSKKGCDRQRPCQRCKDAGLSADQCVSEDEGNGRKGRYGRHMGVKVKKVDDTSNAAAAAVSQYYLQDNQSHGQQMMQMESVLSFGAIGSPDKSKKRKR